MEKEISRLMAEASVQVLQESKAAQAQQQAQQNAQDPVLQMQMQELQLKAKEVDIKERKLMADAAAKADDIRLKELEINSREEIAGMNAQIKVAQEDKSRASKEKEFAVSTGIDMAHKRALLNKPQTKPKGE
jgi:bifunctional N-acetylglucosamine-1-phosphate-uridyltransferase/glucosamine-1-phosphate-acetyltransferase GlmU-like protein